LRFSGGIVVETADARNPPSASPSSLRGAKRQSNPFFLYGSMDCFAALAMTI
jgi:hypothetical protein